MPKAQYGQIRLPDSRQHALSLGPSDLERRGSRAHRPQLAFAIAEYLADGGMDFIRSSTIRPQGASAE
jgi:hypothetical protein